MIVIDDCGSLKFTPDDIFVNERIRPQKESLNDEDLSVIYGGAAKLPKYLFLYRCDVSAVSAPDWCEGDDWKQATIASDRNIVLCGVGYVFGILRVLFRDLTELLYNNYYVYRYSLRKRGWVCLGACLGSSCFFYDNKTTLCPLFDEDGRRISEESHDSTEQ